MEFNDSCSYPGKMSKSGLASVAQSGIDILPVEIAILDEAGEIMIVNQAWRQFADENHADEESYWVGNNYFEICERSFPDNDIESIVDGLQAVLDGNREHFSAEYPCHSPEQQCWMRLDASRFFHDESPHLLISHTNITDEVVARLQAQSRLEQMETLVGVLTHDIRNPINIIQGYTNMLAEDLDDERLDHITSAVTRIAEITEATLHFTKAGTLSQIEPIDVTDIARSAWENVDTKDCTLELVDTFRFHGDRALMLQLFENTYRNAVEHAGHECHVTVGGLEDGFYIADDGPGISEAVITKAIQADFSTDGTGGLGLAIVEAVSEAHGADLKITASKDGGAKLEITGLDSSPEITDPAMV